MPCVLPKQVHVGPFAVVVIQLSRIVSGSSSNQKARGKNPQRAVNLTDCFSSVNLFLLFFCLPLGDPLREQQAYRLIVRTAANYLIGLDQSRGKNGQ